MQATVVLRHKSDPATETPPLSWAGRSSNLTAVAGATVVWPIGGARLPASIMDH